MVTYKQSRLQGNLSEELFYHENYVYTEYGQLWLVSVYYKKNEISTRGKQLHARKNVAFHVIPRFAVHIRDHLRSNLGIISGLGIIRGWGSFAALYTTFYGNVLNSKKNTFFRDFKRKTLRKLIDLASNFFPL